MAQALDGLRVLDLTRVLVGPYATMVLADLGADVVKVELPGRGDDARAYPPHVAGESAYFMSLNRNKRSLTLDLKNPRGRALLMELVAQADVLVENFRPGVMADLGLDYEALSQANPRLIYAATSGFGQTGPYAGRPAYDAIVQAMGGIMSLTGPEGGPPTRVGASIGDIAAGLFTAVGILAALHSRHQSGVGQLVDVSMLDCQVAILENALARYVATGVAPRPIGNRHPAIFPFEPFDTSDGQLMVAAGNDALWMALCRAIGRDDLAADPHYATNPLRHEHYDAMRAELAATFRTRTTAAWQGILAAAEVPNGPINDIAAVVADPQVQAREMIQPVAHPVAGETLLPGIPIKLSATPGAIRRPAPLLGQHGAEVLADWLGYDAPQIAACRATGALGSSPQPITAHP
jgi:CoA:oxalate CoA-transferase